jgi:hypothetical protein
MKTILNKNSDGYGYKYTDLSEIHKYLEENNIRYIQKIERLDGDDYIFTRICFDGKWEEEWIQGCRVVQATLSGIKNPAQEQGSALTYARRYSLLMAFGLATDDDDAQSLSQPIEVTQEDADNYKLTFGKYKGKTLKEINEEKPDYIDWLLGNTKDEYIIKCIELALGKKIPSEEEQGEILKAMSYLSVLMEETETDRDKFYDYYGVKSSKEMTLEQMKDAIEILKKKVGK